MVLNNLFPVFALIGLGCVLKRYGLTHDRYLQTSDRLVYFIFFPAMLFWKIGGAPSAASIPWRFCTAVVFAVLLTYLVSCICIRMFHIGEFQAGSFSQSCYRFNTYIGMAVIITALGESGAAQFGILIGFVIPIINVLAVSTLIWFSGKRYPIGQRLQLTVRALVSNPLILACLAGLGYARIFHVFPLFVENTFRLMAMVTLPLALLSIGGALNPEAVRGHFKVSMIGAVVKLLFFPAVGYGFLKGFDIRGAAFQIGMIFFALPTSTALYVLSSQLNSDTELASATIVLSTVLSFLSLSATLVFFF